MSDTGRGGVRVVDHSRGIAGAYCVHLLRGTGAAVERDETLSSDLPPALELVLRADRQGGDADLGDARPGSDGSSRLVVVYDGCRDRSQVDAVRAASPEAVIVTISPFGLAGPWATAPANEFTLQAWCGSIGGRGDPDRPPVQAGGRLIEWAAGTYAAVGALAALRSDGGEHVDVSLLETGVLVGNIYYYLAKSFGDAAAGAQRTVEVPSILPASDGYVGVCTVTAQQYEDFLVMIGRPELIADDELFSAPQRFARRHEFLATVHAWSQQHTVEQILDVALAFRVPVAPVLAGTSLLELPHFADRGVFQDGPDGLRIPRRPYRATPGPPIADVSPTDDRPLSGLRVIDLTAFLAGPAATHVLAALGADVVKVEGPARSDGMRGATVRRDDPMWFEWGQVFHGVNTGKRGVCIDLADTRGRELLLRLVADAHVVIENFTPRVLDNLRLTYDDLREVNPGVVLVRMPAYGLDGPWRDRSGFAQNMEQVSGLAAITGHPGEHPILPRGPCDPIAGMHAVVALLTQLASGKGAMVEVPMVEAILNVAVEGLVDAQITGRATERLGNRSRNAAPQGVYRAASDDSWLALSVESADQWEAAVEVLGLGEGARGLTARERVDRHDELDELIAQAVAPYQAHELADALLAAGVLAAPVVAPRDVADHPQLRARGFFEELDHPVVGRHRFPTVPFRFGKASTPWLSRPAPVVGEHTMEILEDVGLSAEEIEALRQAGVIKVPMGG